MATSPYLGRSLETNIEDGEITSAKLATGAVTNVKLGTGAVSAAKLGVNSVTEPKIADGAVTGAKLANYGITSIKMNTNAVEAANITPLAVTSFKIDNGAVINAKLGDLAVTEGKLATAVQTKLNAVQGESLTILDTPLQLVSGLTEDTWTTINHATLGGAGATKAIIRMYAYAPRFVESLDAATIYGYIRKTGSGLAANQVTRVLIAADANRYSGATDNAYPEAVCETIVNLSAGSDFDYYLNAEYALSASFIHLIGYYS